MKIASFSHFFQLLDTFCDLRMVVLGLSLIALSSCTNESLASNSPLLGVYIQVDRVGRPGVKEIFESFADHDTSNRNSPSRDTTLPAAITNFMTTAPSILGGPGASASSAATMVNVFSLDELQANLSSTTSGSYLDIEKGVASFGGRRITDPAMEADLGAIYGQSIDPTIPANPCLQSDGLSAAQTAPAKPTTFPYLL